MLLESGTQLLNASTIVYSENANGSTGRCPWPVEGLNNASCFSQQSHKNTKFMQVHLLWLKKYCHHFVEFCINAKTGQLPFKLWSLIAMRVGLPRAFFHCYAELIWIFTCDIKKYFCITATNIDIVTWSFTGFFERPKSF